MKILIAFAVAVIILLFLKAFQWGLKRLSNYYSGWYFKLNYFTAIEFITWIIFIFWSAGFLFEQKSYYPALTYVFVFLITGFLSWYLLNDIFAGVIFKIKHNLKEGNHIKAGDYQGTIHSLHTTFIKIRTENGQLLRIPYSKISHVVITEISKNESAVKPIFKLSIPASTSKSDAENLIRTCILSSPWSNVNEEPAIRFLSQNDQNYMYEVVLFSLNKNHLKYIETSLESNPDIKIVSSGQ